MELIPVSKIFKNLASATKFHLVPIIQQPNFIWLLVSRSRFGTEEFINKMIYIFSRQKSAKIKKILFVILKLFNNDALKLVHGLDSRWRIFFRQKESIGAKETV